MASMCRHISRMAEEGGRYWTCSGRLYQFLASTVYTFHVSRRLDSFISGLTSFSTTKMISRRGICGRERARATCRMVPIYNQPKNMPASKYTVLPNRKKTGFLYVIAGTKNSTTHCLTYVIISMAELYRKGKTRAERA